MASQGAILQEQNNQLVQLVEELKDRRQQLQSEVREQEQVKLKLQEKLKQCQTELDTCQRTLDRKYQQHQQVEQMLSEAELAYDKILESSQTLLMVLQKEQQQL